MHYHSYEEILDRLSLLEKTSQKIVTIETIGRSSLGKPIRAVRISRTKDTDTHALFVGGIHGLEHIGVEMILWLIDTLTKQYEEDTRITELLSEIEVCLVPVVNPDGYEKHQRKNARGVDINRNFGVGFSNHGFWNRNKWFPFYPGPYAYSEPETRAIKDLIERNHFTVAVSFHSFGGRINFPYGHTKKRAKDYELFRAIATGMQKRQRFTKYRIQQLSWLYKPAGCLEDELYETKGTLAFLIEIAATRAQILNPRIFLGPFAWFNPSNNHIQRHLEDITEASMYLLEIAAKRQFH